MATSTTSSSHITAAALPLFSAKFHFRRADNGVYYGGKVNLTADANDTLDKMARAGAFPMQSIKDAGHAYALWLDHVSKIDRALLSEPLQRILGRRNAPLDGALDVVVADGTLTRYLLGPAAEFPETEPRLGMDDKNVVAKLPAAAARRYLLTRMTRPAVPATPRAPFVPQNSPSIAGGEWCLRCAVSLAALCVAASAAWQLCCSNDAAAAAVVGYSSPDWWAAVASRCAETFDEL